MASASSIQKYTVTSTLEWETFKTQLPSTISETVGKYLFKYLSPNDLPRNPYLVALCSCIYPLIPKDVLFSPKKYHLDAKTVVKFHENLKVMQYPILRQEIEKLALQPEALNVLCAFTCGNLRFFLSQFRNKEGVFTLNHVILENLRINSYLAPENVTLLSQHISLYCEIANREIFHAELIAKKFRVMQFNSNWRPLDISPSCDLQHDRIVGTLVAYKASYPYKNPMQIASQTEQLFPNQQFLAQSFMEMGDMIFSWNLKLIKSSTFEEAAAFLNFMRKKTRCLSHQIVILRLKTYLQVFPKYEKCSLDFTRLALIFYKTWWYTVYKKAVSPVHLLIEWKAIEILFDRNFNGNDLEENVKILKEEFEQEYPSYPYDEAHGDSQLRLYAQAFKRLTTNTATQKVVDSKLKTFH